MFQVSPGQWAPSVDGPPPEKVAPAPYLVEATIRTIMKRQFDEREQVESNILLASRLQDHNSALFIQVLKKKSREFQALMDSFWCIRSSKTSTKSGASWCYVPAVWLCVHARGLFNVRIRLRLSYWRWITVNLQAGTHAPRHGRAHTPFFEDLFMQEAVFLNVALCHRCKRGKVG